MKTVRTMKLPKNAGPMASALIPLELTTKEPAPGGPGGATAPSSQPPSLKAASVTKAP
jgi:hypothetical protein